MLELLISSRILSCSKLYWLRLICSVLKVWILFRGYCCLHHIQLSFLISTFLTMNKELTIFNSTMSKSTIYSLLVSCIKSTVFKCLLSLIILTICKVNTELFGCSSLKLALSYICTLIDVSPWLTSWPLTTSSPLILLPLSCELLILYNKILGIIEEILLILSIRINVILFSFLILHILAIRLSLCSLTSDHSYWMSRLISLIQSTSSFNFDRFLVTFIYIIILHALIIFISLSRPWIRLRSLRFILVYEDMLIVLLISICCILLLLHTSSFIMMILLSCGTRICCTCLLISSSLRNYIRWYILASLIRRWICLTYNLSVLHETSDCLWVIDNKIINVIVVYYVSYLLATICRIIILLSIRSFRSSFIFNCRSAIRLSIKVIWLLSITNWIRYKIIFSPR